MGDFFTQQGTPTLLFEAGQVGQDYARKETRKWYGFSILKALQCISLNLYMLPIYHKIPEVEKSFVDVLIQNLTYQENQIDIALRYVEVLDGNQINFIPVIHKMGKLDSLIGHRNIDVSNKTFHFVNTISIESNAVWLADLLNLTHYSH